MIWKETAGVRNLSPLGQFPCAPLDPQATGSCRKRMFIQHFWQERRFSLCPEGTVQPTFHRRVGPVPSMCRDPTPGVGRYWAFSICVLFLSRSNDPALISTGTSKLPLPDLNHPQSPLGTLPGDTLMSSAVRMFPASAFDNSRFFKTKVFSNI